MMLCSLPLFLEVPAVYHSDGGGGDRGGSSSLEVHHKLLWQVELHHLLQEGHPLLTLSDEEADVLLPFEVLDDGSQELGGTPQRWLWGHMG